MRVLITGATGFVGRHLHSALRRTCDDITIIATSREGGPHDIYGDVEALDVTDRAAVEAAIAHHSPTHVIHLAAMAAPAAATADPRQAWEVHVHAVQNVAQAILSAAPECWLLHVGSGLVYGASARPGLPLDEAALLVPVDDYAVTKAAADLALGALVRRGLKCIRLRPFNHTGPGQTESFVIPAFAAQIARIEKGLVAPVIQVGNLDSERDFLDVRDVTSAYAMAVQKSDTLEPDLILNIASGVPRRIGDILDWLLRQAKVDIAIEQDMSRMRPSDLPRIIGDAAHARACLGWAPEHEFEDTLAATLESYRAAQGGGISC